MTAWTSPDIQGVGTTRSAPKGRPRATVSEKVLPSHCRMKEVRATAQRISLMAEVA